MWHVLLFAALQLCASAFAWRRGGLPEKIAGAALLAAYVASLIAWSESAQLFRWLEAGAMWVDLILLGVLIGLALFADRFWTMPMAALQGLGAMSHLVKATGFEPSRLSYAVETGAWSYPIVLLLFVATGRHLLRVRRHGYDLDWSLQDPADR